MLVQLYTILSLFVFLVAMLLGSTLEPAIVKSTLVFISLVVGTKTGSYLVNIMRVSNPQEEGTIEPAPKTPFNKAA